jgi:hypothetical protein
MENLKKHLIENHAFLNWRGIERELGLPFFTIKKWVANQNTVPPFETQKEIYLFLKGKNLK